jgi:Protein of unknown function (DUF3800)
MKIFIDDSGGFGWTAHGVSLFCGVTISDKNSNTIMSNFHAWRSRQPNYRGFELKGKDLSPTQQTSFANSVVLSTRGLSLTLAGTNTTLFKKEIAQQVVNDTATILRAAAVHSPHAAIADFFRRMARWMEARSPENLLWIHCLGDAIHLSLQHGIVKFAEEAHDSEFENIEVLIDRSFIAKSTHIEFWQEWLRNYLYSKSKKEPFATISEWRERDHPFRRKYEGARGMIDWTDLYRNHVHFVDSQDLPGIQIADVCANICYRFYSENPKYRPYRLLRSRIIGKDGSEMHYAIFNETSLLTDAPENHVTDYFPEEIAAMDHIAASKKESDDSMVSQ